ncbi:MAG: type toxin-antitoxin system RelE/ParE family toxin [Verrucomicrobiales bacterium]|nr:type toxin-antitoxin system RelE/ParE family toxin [Verrucomicrobiales bacterium]
MKLVISEAAQADLSHIYAFLYDRNESAAERFGAAVEKALDLLAMHPEIGPKPGWTTRHTHLRFWVISQFNNYLIFYELRPGEISIERILDGRRDIREVLENEKINPEE